MQIHGSCAARQGAGVLLLGPSGSGKSDLLFRLLDRGFDLVADDRVDIIHGWASAPAVLAGVIEVRGLGLLRMAYAERVKIALAIKLGPTDRLPRPQIWDIAAVPLMALDPRPASAAQQVGWALDCVLQQRQLIEGALA